MRWKIIIVTTFFLVLSFFISLEKIYQFYWKNHDNTVSQFNQGKIIAVNISIKDNLPLIDQADMPRKLYFLLTENKTSLINLLNKINISGKYFILNHYNLAQTIFADYSLLLVPKQAAIKYYNRYTITKIVLLNLGMTAILTDKIMLIFSDSKNTREDIIVKLQELLTARWKKFFFIMKEFIIF